MTRCPDCHVILAEGEMKCPDCGYVLLSDSRKARGKKYLAIAIILMLLLPVGVGGFVACRRFQLKKQLEQGNEFLTGGQFAQALEAFGKVLEIDGGNTEARLGSARSLKALGRYSEAEDVLEAIIKSEPDVIDAWELLCEVKLAKEDIAGALADIERCYQVLGNNPLGDLFLELAADISVITDKEQLFSGEWANLELLYAGRDSNVLLVPQWSISEKGNLDIKADGSAKVSMDSPGEIIVSAKLGPIEREVALTVIQNGAQQAAQLVKDFSYPFLLPQFFNPNELDNEILLIMLINWVQRYTGEEKYVISAEEVEAAAATIFGPKLQLAHCENFLAQWDEERAEYEIIPMGLDGAAITYILDCREVKGKYIVNAVHLMQIADDGDNCIIEDDNGTALGRYEWDRVEAEFTAERLARLPQRRYVFTVLPDGSFHMTESRIIY